MIKSGQPPVLGQLTIATMFVLLLLADREVRCPGRSDFVPWLVQQADRRLKTQSGR